MRRSGVQIPEAAPRKTDIFLPLITRWLANRVPKALEEQSRGVNPMALIFPNPSGGLFGEQNLRNWVRAPAAKELGWAMDGYVTALGKKRASGWVVGARGVVLLSGGRPPMSGRSGRCDGRRLDSGVGSLSGRAAPWPRY